MIKTESPKWVVAGEWGGAQTVWHEGELQSTIVECIKENLYEDSSEVVWLYKVTCTCPQEIKIAIVEGYNEDALVQGRWGYEVVPDCDNVNWDKVVALLGEAYPISLSITAHYRTSPSAEKENVYVCDVL